ncbi:MAG: hypothetical protein L6Q35_14135 [Phycisphaerales bacterium]|nr:hypothetical protein [Phycisphaerales bacterium]
MRLIASGISGAWVAAAVVAICLCAGAALAQETLALSRYNQQEPDWGAELRLIREHFALDKDQAATVAMLLSGAYSEQRMQRRVYDRRRAVWESEDGSEKSRAAAAAENQRYADRRLAIETTWLRELRDLVLTPEQAARWESYEQARRVNELMIVNSSGELRLTEMLRHVELTPDEKTAVADPLERHMKSLDEIARKYLAASSTWLAIRWGRMKGDLDKAEAQRDQSTTGLNDVLRAGLRSVCDVLPPEKAAALRATFEIKMSLAEYGWSRLEEHGIVGDYLKIATLSDDQRDRIRAAFAESDNQMIKLARAYREKRTAVRHNPPQYEEVRNTYYRDRARATLAAIRTVRAILTDEQRAAFDEGREPPVDQALLRQQFGDMDEYYQRAWESED